MARLRILAGANSTTHELPEAETVTIGRGAPNAIALADLSCSSRHSQLVKDSLGWRIEDRGSRNGTIVNGNRINSAHLLRHSDQIQIGATEIVFEETTDTIASAPPDALGQTGKFLQSLVGDPEHLHSPNEFAGGLLHSLVIDESEDSVTEFSQLEFLRVDGPKAPRTKDTFVLKKSTEKNAAPDSPQTLVPEKPFESLAETKLRLIQRVSEKLVRIFDAKQLMDEIMSIVIDQAKADRGILCLLDDNRQPVPIATRGMGEDEQVRFSRSVLKKLLEERAGVVIGQSDLSKSSGGENMLRSLVEMRVYSTVCVPLWTGDNIIGILSLDSTTPGKFFSQEDLELLLAVAHQAAIGIERGRLSQMFESERQVRAYLSKYLDNRIVQHISDHKAGDDPLAPAEKVVTVLFSDIVSFTKMSEGMQPAELANFVKEYLTAMTEIIFKHGGTIDKYIGDAVMALFGAPVPSEDSCVQAIRAAIEMRERINDFQIPGKAGSLRVRFGINTGLVVVGNIGSSRRMEYTALGDAVNVASRLQSFARPNEICIDEVTQAKTGGQFAVEEIGTIDVKNRAQGVAVFKVLRAK